MAEIRTYETFSVRWTDGASWSGYQTDGEARATVESAEALGRRRGSVVRKAWNVVVPAADAARYMPGCASVRLFSLIDSEGLLRFHWRCSETEAIRFATRYAVPGDRLVDSSARIVAVGSDLLTALFA